MSVAAIHVLILIGGLNHSLATANFADRASCENARALVARYVHTAVCVPYKYDGR